jgi:tRNA (adenine22-N1)-methyltransferase
MRILMEIKGRLKAIADFVRPCDISCDIGTDHAYIPIYLIKNEICNKCIAADKKEGPLRTARANIIKEDLKDRIEIRKGYGLEPIARGEADTVIITGMGGMLINEILSHSIDKTKRIRSIILQPMNAVEKTRKWLLKSGYEIKREVLQKEDNKIYCIIETVWCGNAQNEDDVFYYIGKKLIEKKDPLLLEYIGKQLIRFDKKIKGIGLSSQKKGLKEAVSLRDKMTAIYENVKKT